MTADLRKGVLSLKTLVFEKLLFFLSERFIYGERRIFTLIIELAASMIGHDTVGLGKCELISHADYNLSCTTNDNR